MGDCPHINDNDNSIGCIADGVDVFGAHRDGFALLELHFATIEEVRGALQTFNREPSYTNNEGNDARNQQCMSVAEHRCSPDPDWGADCGSESEKLPAS